MQINTELEAHKQTEIILLFMVMKTKSETELL